MKERWKDICGYEGLYQISDLGRVKSLNRISTVPYLNTFRNRSISEKISIGIKRNNGYLFYKLFDKNGRPKQVAIHRLVANHFINNTHNKPFINHIDCDRSNNCVSNLEWVTPKENSEHASKLLRFNTIRVKCDQTGKEYNGIRNAERELGIATGSITKVINGKLKTIHKLTFSTL
jgi:hypothetical protein